MNHSIQKWSYGLMILLFACLAVAGCAGKEGNSTMAAMEQPMEQEAVAMKTIDPPGHCPQTRGTVPAPEPFASMMNPLPASNENISGGKLLFHEDARPMPCETCHGFKGNGFGVIFQQMKPYPRDFTCYQVMSDLSDGQLFWIIRNGSHGTRMKGFAKLTEDQAWQLVHYIRSLSK